MNCIGLCLLAKYWNSLFMNYLSLLSICQCWQYDHYLAKSSNGQQLIHCIDIVHNISVEQICNFSYHQCFWLVGVVYVLTKHQFIWSSNINWPILTSTSMYCSNSRWLLNQSQPSIQMKLLADTHIHVVASQTMVSLL